MALSALGLMVLSAVVDRRVNALHVTLWTLRKEQRLPVRRMSASPRVHTRVTEAWCACLDLGGVTAMKGEGREEPRWQLHASFTN